jgi:hypothetical protein
MGTAEGFTFEARGDGAGTVVVVTHRGRTAATLRGERALAFLDEVGPDAHGAHAQRVMARWTGNYRRGTERTARDHPRNRTGR